MCTFGKSAQQKIAEQQQRDERQRQAKVKKGIAGVDAKFAPFGDEYFQGRKKAFFEANLPQLMDTFRGARAKLNFGLARQGQIGPGGATSKSAIQRTGGLFANMNANRQALMGQGFDFAARERGGFDVARRNIISELRASHDPTAAFAAADTAINQFGQSPIGSATPMLFANLSGIAADAVNPPIDWRALTRSITTTTPKPYAVVR